MITVAWAYYIFTLLPVVGLVQVGGQAAADRYKYLPSIAPFILVGLVAGRLSTCGAGKAKGTSGFGFAAGATTIGIVVISLVLGSMTIKQTKVWKDTISLWSRVIDVYPIELAIKNRALLYHMDKRYELAIKDYTVLIESKLWNPAQVASQAGRCSGQLRSPRGGLKRLCRLSSI